MKTKNDSAIEKTEQAGGAIAKITSWDSIPAFGKSEEVTIGDLAALGGSVKKFHTLQAGEFVRGVFVGPGAVMMMEKRGAKPDPVTGETPREQAVKTWLLDTGAILFTLCGAAQLDQRLAEIRPGMRVLIRHEGIVTTRKNNKANDYTIVEFGIDPNFKAPPALASTGNGSGVAAHA